MNGTPWPEARARALAEMWGRGFSAARIAQRLGGVSRSAVCGKLMRMGLNDRNRASWAQVLARTPGPKPRFYGPGEAKSA